MPKKKTDTPTATPGTDQPGPLDLAGLTVNFPANVRLGLLALGESLGLGVRGTQELVAGFYADREHGAARAAELVDHLRLPLTRHKHEQELAALKARQEEIEAALGATS